MKEIELLVVTSYKRGWSYRQTVKELRYINEWT